MNGSTVGESDTSGQFSGQCQSCGLYTAYGAQFMMGSCHTIVVVTIIIRMYGCFGYRFQSTKQTANIVAHSTMVPICIWVSMVGPPTWDGTGRGAPCAASLRMRSSTAPKR